MNLRKYILVALTAFLGVCGLVKAQDAFFLNEKTFRFEPIRHSNAFIQANEVRLNLYGQDKAHSGRFRIPTDLMYKYMYIDSNSVIGSLEYVVMAKPEDFEYVSSICLKAQADARQYYKTWKASMCGTLFLTMVNPVLGLAVAIPASATTPKIENLGLSDVDMLEEDIYFHIYRKEAKKLKSKRNWMAYGIGFGVHIGIVFGIVTAVEGSVNPPHKTK